MKPATSLLVFCLLASTPRAAAGETDPLPERAEHLSRLTIDLLDADTALCARKMTAIDAAPQNGAREDQRRLLVEFWAIVDPAAALRYVENSTLRPRVKQTLLDAVVRGWTRSSPEAAWAWSIQHPVREQLDLPRAALETVAATAPDRGLAWLKSLTAAQTPRPDSDFAERAFAFFFKLCEAGDYAAVRQLVDQLPPGELREQLLFSVTERMGRYTLDAATAWSLARSDQPDAYYPQAAVALEKVRRDFDDAFAWVLAIKNAAVRPQLVRTIAGDVVIREPTVANVERILAKLSGEPERQAAYAAFATTPDLVRVSPVSIMEGAWTIADLQDRRLSLVRGYSYWHAVDKNAARRHLARAGQGRDEDRKIVERFLNQPDEP